MVNDRLKRLEMVRSAWDAYHPDYMGFHLWENPDSHKEFADGAVMLDDHVIEVVGEVNGQKLLDICCGCDATQAFPWANLGADVTACDISAVAIKIARANAQRIGLPVAFRVADAQTLDPIGDESFDIVVAAYVMWFEDVHLARRHGGWGQTRPVVEFHHTLAGIVNAALDAGFRLKRVEEPSWEKEGALADLPAGFISLWQK